MYIAADTPFEKAAIRGVSTEIYRRASSWRSSATRARARARFIQHLNGLLRPDEAARSSVDGDGHFRRRRTATRDVRFKVGLVFQYPEYQLFEETVYRDIAFGPKNMKLSEAEMDERRARRPRALSAWARSSCETSRPWSSRAGRSGASP